MEEVKKFRFERVFGVQLFFAQLSKPQQNKFFSDNVWCGPVKRAELKKNLKVPNQLKVP